METQAQYEARELKDAQKTIRALSRQRVEYRREAFENFLDELRQNDMGSIERAAEWLLCGNYGFGPMLLALEAYQNRNASALLALVANFEFSLSAEDANMALWCIGLQGEQNAHDLMAKVMKEHAEAKELEAKWEAEYQASIKAERDQARSERNILGY